jgi:hypothetical protein
VRRAGLKLVPAGANYIQLLVMRMDPCFHDRRNLSVGLAKF